VIIPVATEELAALDICSNLPEPNVLFTTLQYTRQPSALAPIRKWQVTIAFSNPTSAVILCRPVVTVRLEVDQVVG